MNHPLTELWAMSPETFLEQHWPEAQLVVHGALERLPEFFRSPLLSDPTELAKIYRGSFFVTHRGSKGQHEVRGENARVYFDDLGVSVRFENVDDYLAGASPWMRALERDLGVPRGSIMMGAFVNATGSGLVPHCDPYEGFLVHIRGTKVFRLARHPSVRFASMMHSSSGPVPGAWLAQSTDGLPGWRSLPAESEVRLLPGSALFMPRGLYHETKAEDDVSVSLTLVIRTPSAAELFHERLAGYLLQSEAWRTPLVGGWAADADRREAARARVRRLLGDLASKLPALDVDALFGASTAKHFSVDECLPQTRFQRDSGTALRVREGAEGKLELEVESAAGHRVTKTLPVEARPLVEWLREKRTAFTFGALCETFDDWDVSSLASVAVFLVKSSALTLLPFSRYDATPDTRAARVR